MEKIQAIDKVLGEYSLSPLERVILIQMIKHSATDHICALSHTQLSEYCACSRRSVRELIVKLEKDGYVVTIQKSGYTARYIPFPYSENLISVKEKDKTTGRLTITPEQGSFMLGVLAEKENALTLLARDAQTRHDHAGHKEAIVQIDMIFDIKDTLDRFIKRTVNKA